MRAAPARFLALVAAGLTAAAVAPASLPAQTVLFSSFGPAPGFSAFPYGVDGIAGGFQAFRFTATATGTVEELTVALGRTGAATTATRFTLYDGTDPTSLGAELASYLVPNAVPPVPAAPFSGEAVTFLTGAGGPTLLAGESYWLAFSEDGAADGSESLWFMTDPPFNGTRLTTFLPAHTNAMPAFALSATSVVPEPSTTALLGAGLLGLGALGARRRSGRARTT